MHVIRVEFERDFVVPFAPVEVDSVVILVVGWVCMVVVAKPEAVLFCAFRAI